MKPTKKQKSVLKELRKVDGFNDMDPKQVIRVLTKNLNLWKDGFFEATEDDVLYLVPKKGKEKDVEIMALRCFSADEVDWYGPTHGPIDSEIVRDKKMDRLRVWWD